MSAPRPAPGIRHGVDLVLVPRIRGVMERQPRFEEEIFTEGERAYCRHRHDPFPHFAARFAAKEALLKALRRGIFGGGGGDERRALQEVEVVRTVGAPSLVARCDTKATSPWRSVVRSAAANALVVASKVPFSVTGWSAAARTSRRKRSTVSVRKPRRRSESTSKDFISCMSSRSLSTSSRSSC